MTKVGNGLFSLTKMDEITLVLGASPNTNRYSYHAVARLRRSGRNVIAVGRRKGNIEGVLIQQIIPQVERVHTVALYLSPQNQREYYEAILALKPERIIFNPGSENPELFELAEAHGMNIVEGCVLVMLTTKTY